MADYILPLQRLIEQFRALPGIGGKTAARMAFAVVEGSEERAEAFADAILAAKRDIRKCAVCGNMSTEDICPICADDERDRGIICVVEDARDVLSFERIRDYRGVYHVLGGLLSPMNGVGVDDLRIRELLERVNGKQGEDGTVTDETPVKEVLIATGATVEGEATAMYLARLLAPFPVEVTRLAYGIPVGGDLEYADEITLHRALEGRRSYRG